jgi:phospholipid/cholesterol/gamma-HCH transport system permease protein
MYPYNVNEVTMPSSHRTSRITKIVQSISFLPSSFRRCSCIGPANAKSGTYCAVIRGIPLAPNSIGLTMEIAASNLGTTDTSQHRSAAGRMLAGFFDWFGQIGLFCGRLVRAAVQPPYEWRELLRQCDAIGALSFPLVALAGAATGVVLSMETRESLSRFGAETMLPSVIVFSILKESGPIITGLIVSGRVGAGIGAELGSMKVTEQIDAMEVSGVDPFRFLVATRVLACILMLPLLTLASDFFGVLMGWITNSLQEPISIQFFFQSGFKRVDFSDFLPSTLKTMVYGLIIGVIACFEGIRTTGGTEGVGRSTTRSVVLASLFVILADVLLVRLILAFFP